jgi:hypothetical protein
MAWITLKCTSDITQGDVLSYDTTLNLYTRAKNINTPISVAQHDAIEDENNPGTYYVRSQMQGQIQAKASRDIVNQGGYVAVENGAVYVDNSNVNSNGIIWHSENVRVAGDLVTITLR